MGCVEIVISHFMSPRTNSHVLTIDIFGGRRRVKNELAFGVRTRNRNQVRHVMSFRQMADGCRHTSYGNLSALLDGMLMDGEGRTIDQILFNVDR